MTTPFLEEPHLDSFDAMRRAAKAIEDAARAKSLSFKDAEEIARRHGADLGMVFGHLALVQTCEIDYGKGTVRCRSR